MTGLTVRLERRLAASPQRVWQAWTDPAMVLQWWGPVGVTCSHVEMDVRVGGAYAIRNETPDGHTVVVQGSFIEVEPGRRLVYSWGSSDAPPRERVTVTFEADGAGTRLTVQHERIGDEALRRGHEMGWQGCLSGLETWLRTGRRAS